MEKKNKFLIFIYSIFTIIRVGMFLRIPYYAVGSTQHDGMYYVSRVQGLLTGDWLGIYNGFTLCKGPSYLFFLALAEKLYMPYPFLLALFYCMGAALLLIALKDKIKNDWLRLLIYLFIIFNPCGFSFSVGQQIYRNSVVFPAVLWVVASLIGLYIRFGDDNKKLIIWSILSGFSFSFFYYLREDSIWLMPMFAFVPFLYIIKHLMKNGRRKMLNNLIIMCIPMIIFVGSTFTIKSINYKYYGLFTVCDRTDTYFADFVGNLLKVKDGKSDNTDVWVSVETWERVIDECPSLQPIGDDIIRDYREWSAGRKENELTGDIYVWSFRTTLAKTGYYSNAIDMNNYCKQINSELELAFNEGRLKKYEAIYFTSQSKGIKGVQLLPYCKDVFINMWNVGTYKNVHSKTIKLVAGSSEQIRLFEAVTGTLVMHKNIDNVDDQNTVINNYVCITADKIIIMYRIFSCIAIVVALIFFVIIFIEWCRDCCWEKFDRFIILIGMLLSAYISELGVTIFCDWLEEDSIWFYSSGVSATLNIFMALAIAWGGEIVVKGWISKYKMRKGGKKKI